MDMKPRNKIDLINDVAEDTSIDVNGFERRTVDLLRSNKELWLRVKEFVSE